MKTSDFLLGNRIQHGVTLSLGSQQKLGVSIALQVIILPTKKEISTNKWYIKKANF